MESILFSLSQLQVTWIQRFRSQNSQKSFCLALQPLRSTLVEAVIKTLRMISASSSGIWKGCVTKDSVIIYSILIPSTTENNISFIKDKVRTT